MARPPSARSVCVSGRPGWWRSWCRRTEGGLRLISLRDLRRPRSSAIVFLAPRTSANGTRSSRFMKCGVEERAAGRSRSEIKRSPPPSRVLRSRYCPAEIHSYDPSPCGRAIREGTSPLPAPRRVSKQNPFRAADLTFAPEWLKFSPLRAERIALQSRLAMQAAEAVRARRTRPRQAERLEDRCNSRLNARGIPVGGRLEFPTR